MQNSMNVLSKLDQSMNSSISNCRIPQPSIINSATRNMNAKSLENQENVQTQGQNKGKNDKHMTNDSQKGGGNTS